MAPEDNLQNATYLKTLRTASIGIFILLIVAAIYLARDFLIPVVLAFFVALTFRPAVRRMASKGIPSWATALGFALTLFLAFLGAVYFASGPISGWIADAPEIQRKLVEKFHDFSDYFSGLAQFVEKIQSVAALGNGTETGIVVRDTGMLSRLSQYAAHPIYVIFTLLGTLVLAIFLMASGDLFYEKLVKVLPTLSEKKTALRIVYDVEREVSTYLLTVSAINAGLAACVGIAFYILAMPTPFLWSLLVFALNFIPYLGPMLGVSLTFLVGIVVFDTMGLTLLAPLVYIILVGFESEVVTPLFLSRRLALNSVAILLSLTFWAWAWGVVGIVLAVPLLVTLRVFCGHVEKLSAIGEFLGESDRSLGEPAATITAGPAD